MNKNERDLLLDICDTEVIRIRNFIKKSNHFIITLKFDKQDNLNAYDLNRIETKLHGIRNAEARILKVSGCIRNLNNVK